MTKVTLRCTDDQFHELHLAVDRARGVTVKVNKAALSALLMDHSKLIDIHKDKIEWPT